MRGFSARDQPALRVLTHGTVPRALFVLLFIVNRLDIGIAGSFGIARVLDVDGPSGLVGLEGAVQVGAHVSSVDAAAARVFAATQKTRPGRVNRQELVHMLRYQLKMPPLELRCRPVNPADFVLAAAFDYAICFISIYGLVPYVCWYGWHVL